MSEPRDAERTVGAAIRSLRKARGWTQTDLERESNVPQRTISRIEAATNMIWAGIPLPTVSKILGHATPAVTLSTYAHVIATMEGQAVQAIEAFYGASVPASGRNERDRLRLIV